MSLLLQHGHYSKPDLVRGLGHSQRAADLRCTTTVNDPIINDEIPHNADGIVQCALRLIDDLLMQEYD